MSPTYQLTIKVSIHYPNSEGSLAITERLYTTEYHKTKDILHVMQMLGHRDIKTTLIYAQLIQFESEDRHSAVAKTIEEARSLIETGFEYVTDIDGVKLFRKRK